MTRGQIIIFFSQNTEEKNQLLPLNRGIMLQTGVTHYYYPTSDEKKKINKLHFLIYPSKGSDGKWIILSASRFIFKKKGTKKNERKQVITRTGKCHNGHEKTDYSHSAACENNKSGSSLWFATKFFDKSRCHWRRLTIETQLSWFVAFLSLWFHSRDHFTFTFASCGQQQKKI